MVLVANNRVLVKDQTAGSENGIYVVVDGGSWTRATDFDSNSDVTAGVFTFVEEGTNNADTGWVLSTNDAITLASTSLTFTQFSNAGVVSAGSGLSKSGNTLSIDSTVATLTGSQTLTNKTLTTPILSTPTINAAALSGTLSGTPTFSGVGTHSALDVFNAGISVKNGSTSAGFIELYEDSDNGSNKATLIGPASTSDVTITLPAATDTLVGLATTDTLTNKTLTNPTISGQLLNTNLPNRTLCNIQYADYANLASRYNRTTGEQTPADYTFTITPTSANSLIKLSFKIGYLTSFEADQTMSFHVYREIGSNSAAKLVEDLELGNGNAAGPLVSAWHFEYIDNPSSTDAVIYSLRYTLDGANTADFDSGIVGNTSPTVNTDQTYTYRSINSMIGEELYIA